MIFSLLLIAVYLASELIEKESFSFDRTILMALRQQGAPAIPIGPGWLLQPAIDIGALGGLTLLRYFAGRESPFCWRLDASLPGPQQVERTIEQIDLVKAIVARYPQDFALAVTADDVRRTSLSFNPRKSPAGEMGAAVPISWRGAIGSPTIPTTNRCAS